MKNILVPCDFSKKSIEAFKVALDLATKNNGKITLLYIFHIPTPFYDGGIAGEPLSYNPIYLTNIIEDAKKELEKVKNDVKDLSVQVNTEVQFGELVYSITHYVQTNKIDLVIMGTSGASGLSSFFIGSNTEKVIRHSTVPVLAVRQAFQLDNVKNILLPNSMSIDQPDFMYNLKNLQNFFGATLHILLINTPAHFINDAVAQTALEEFTKKYELKNVKTYFRNYYSEEEGIINFATTEKMDLIAMATHGRKGISHLFNGSIAEDVVNKINAPIWTYCLKKNQ